MIACEGLGKDFRQYKKAAGFRGSVAAFFKRDYQTRAALDQFDLRIEPGEMVGLLGPNGAGKTTLMKILSGIIVPSRGKVRVCGHIPHEREQAFRKKIALVMGQKSQLWWDIPAMDSFLLLQRYYELDETSFRRRLGELVELLGVERQLEVHVRKLSLGERMKMELMACLLHRPEVLFLDEPTIGLDLTAQRNIREFIQRYQKEHRTTVILTSHYMADVEALCDRIVLVLGGEKRFDGSIDAFTNMLGREKCVRVSFEVPVDTSDPYWLSFDPEWTQDGLRVDLRLPEDNLRGRAVEILQRYPVSEFTMEQMPIERVMHELLDKPQLLGRDGVSS